MSTNQANARPTVEDVASRLIVLKYVVVYALTAPPRESMGTLFQHWSTEDLQKFGADAEARREEFWRPLRQADLWKAVAPSERELAEATIVTMSPQQQVNATWRMEAAQVLMWALDLLPQLPSYDTQANPDLLKQIQTADIPRFVSSSHLRAELEIRSARDEAELWHWRSRTRQLVEESREIPSVEETVAAGFRSYDEIVRFTANKLAQDRQFLTIDEDFPVKCKAYRELNEEEWSEVRSITMERHFALNWLCGFAPSNEWDETPTDT
jgi:hypothetical protein